MGQLCAVSFNRYGRLFYLDPGDHRPNVGDLVLVPTDDGAEVAECVWAPEWTDEDTDPDSLSWSVWPARTTCGGMSRSAAARPTPRWPPSG